MKCDTLKSVYIDRTGDWCRSENNTGKFYLKEEVDAVIAKLEAKLENVQASMYADVVDANMDNRRLRRALWIARARRAKERQRMLPNNKEFYTRQEVERRCSKKAEEYK